MKCEDCIDLKYDLKGKTPIGWLPFAWGHSQENPMHFYVYPESTKIEGDIQELPVTKLCEVPNPLVREF